MENFRVLSTFVNVVTAGNFSRAANALGITPQAVSLHIKQLEDRVGVRLFNRSTRGISLTDEGQRFYHTCSGALSAIEDELQVLRDTGSVARGNIRIAAPHSFGWRFVAPAIAKFRAQYPDITIELVIQNKAPDMLSEGIDLSVLADPLTERALIARKFATMQSIICATPDYLAKKGRPSSFEDLENHDCVSLKNWVDGRPIPWRYRESDESISRQFPSTIVTDDGDSALQLVLAGAGIAQLASYRITEHLANGSLVALFPSNTFEYNFYLAMQNRTLIPKRTRALSDFLFQELRAHPALRA